MTKPHRDRRLPEEITEDLSKLAPSEAVMRLYWSAMGDKPKLSISDSWTLVCKVQEALSTKKAEDHKDRFVSWVAFLTIASVLGVVVTAVLKWVL